MNTTPPDTFDPPAFRCISLETDGRAGYACVEPGVLLVWSTAGWQGTHCERHALRVIGTMLWQVGKGYPITIRKVDY